MFRPYKKAFNYSEKKPLSLLERNYQKGKLNAKKKMQKKFDILGINKYKSRL